MKHTTKYFLTAIIITFFIQNNLFSQIKGEPPRENTGRDSVLVFEPARPLVDTRKPVETLSNAWGGDLIFSNSGFGAGIFFQKYVSETINIFASLYISGARNTDELEYYNPNTNEFFIPGKINRLYMFPLTFGIQKFLFHDLIFNNLRPFLNVGVGPTFILSTPYSKEFFSAFSYADFYTRFGTFLGAGADIGTFGKNLMSVSLRYYYIPFGDKGLESIIDNPIKDFGGVFLSLSIGRRY